jgi:hypothetical protein
MMFFLLMLSWKIIKVLIDFLLVLSRNAIVSSCDAYLISVARQFDCSKAMMLLLLFFLGPMQLL